MNSYKAFYNGKSTDVQAETLYAAKLKAIVQFKPPRSKEHMVSVILCEQDGAPVTHSTAEIG